jgi:hypothetical protein
MRQSRLPLPERKGPRARPFYRLTRKIRGKTVTETFATPVALRKAQSEVAEFHRFRELSHSLLDVNEKICQVRPVADTLTAQEKKQRPRSGRSRTRSKRVAPDRLSGPPQNRQAGPGSNRDGDASRHASGRGCRTEPVTSMRTARPGPAGDSMSLRSASALPRDAVPARAYCGRGD